MTTDDRSLSPLLTAFRHEYLRLRAERAVRLELRRELAEYASDADRLELAAMLRRHSAGEAAEVRALLD